VTCAAHDALADKIDAQYVWLPDQRTVVMEVSEAAGMRRLQDGVRDVMRANTFGVGEMLLDAIQRGPAKIIIGLGGSATNDGGFGMARALGFRFLDEQDHEIQEVADLISLANIEDPVAAGVSPAKLSQKPATSPSRGPLQTKIVAAVDVKNPLLGENGATRTFGPQKGASPEQLETLERGLAKLADAVGRDLGCDFRNMPGAGAAGGLGFALMSFCGAEVLAGFDVVADTIGLKEKIKHADIVITGEGKLDRQTLQGKAPAGVARLARNCGKPVFAIVGRAEADQSVREMFDEVYVLGGSLPQAAELLQERARELATRFKQ
jgi:glycerate kinase